MMHVIKHNEALAPMFKPGTILWRSVSHNAKTGPVLHDVKFEKTDQGSYLGRIMMYNTYDFIWEPTLTNNRQGEQNIFGLVVFINQEIPENWTHLIINGVSKALRRPYKGKHTQIKGGALFATVGEQLPIDDYKNFRQQMFETVKRHANSDFNKKLREASKIWPETKLEPDTYRLIAHYRYSDPEILVDYAHTHLPVEDEVREEGTLQEG